MNSSVCQSQFVSKDNNFKEKTIPVIDTVLKFPKIKTWLENVIQLYPIADMINKVYANTDKHAISHMHIEENLQLIPLHSHLN